MSGILGIKIDKGYEEVQSTFAFTGRKRLPRTRTVMERTGGRIASKEKNGTPVFLEPSEA